MNDSTDPGTTAGPVSRRTVLAGSALAIGAAGFAGTASGQTTVTGVIDRVRRWEDADLDGFEIETPDTDDADGATAAPAGGGEGDGTDQTAEGRAGTDGDAAGTVDGGATADGTATGVAGATDEPETPDCDFRDWPPDDVERYDVRLVDRKADDATEEDTTLWVSADVEIGRDAQFLVNDHRDCGDGYVGVELEDLGGSGGESGRAEEDVEDFEEGTPAGGNGQDEGAGAETPVVDDGGAETTEEGPGFGVLAALAGAAGLGGLLSRRSD